MTALAVTAGSLTGEQWVRIVVVSLMIGLSVVTCVVAAWSRWGADSYEEPPVYDRARDRQWDVTETTGLPGLSPVDPLAVDHAWCAAHDDGECDDLVCCCRDAAAPCPGTVELGCEHDGIVVCERHRGSSCDRCRAERRADLDRVASW